MKRRATKLLLFLFVGATINVGVAWGIAAWLDVDANRRQDAAWQSADVRWNAAKWKRIGSLAIWSSWDTVHQRNFQNRGEAPDVFIPQWTGIRIPSGRPEPKGPLYWSLQIGRYNGWPAFSVGSIVECDSSVGWNRKARFHPALELHDSFDEDIREAWHSKILPLRPLWPGFAINTMFYAAILWLLFAFPFTVRRWRRIKLGRCTSCGYDLRGRAPDSDTCSECGEAVNR